VTPISNAVTRDSYMYATFRSGIMTQNGPSGGCEDSEWYACLIQGGGSASEQWVTNGIWTGGGGLRFIGCHPYWCASNGLYALSGMPLTTGGYVQYPAIDIIAGEYETNGVAGINTLGCGGVTITGGVSMYANTQYDVYLSGTASFRISDNWMISGYVEDVTPEPDNHIYVYQCDQGSIHDNFFSGVLTGDLIEITGSGPNSNLEIVVHDNVITASGGTPTAAIALVNAAGVNVHDNTCEASIVESGTSDYNLIHDNTMVNLVGAFPVIILDTPNHTRSYDNPGQCPAVYANANATAQSDRLYALDGTSNTVALTPPGGNLGGVSIAASTAIGGATIALSAAPSAWPEAGYALIKGSSGAYQVINYTGISGDDLTGCSGGSGSSSSSSSTAYPVPDLSLTFQAVAINTTHAVTIACPTGCQINGGTSALTLTSGHLYTGVFNPDASVPEWLIY
jgi:hypothetical protein